MKVIWKYHIPITDTFNIKLPKGYEILHVGVQNKNPRMWVLIDTKAEMEKVSFFCFATGEPIDEMRSKNMLNLGTVILNDGLFVFHIFKSLLPNV